MATARSERSEAADHHRSLVDLLVCPVTLEKLSLQPSGASLTTASGSHRYAFTDGAWDLVPDPLPANLAAKAELWQKLQANGALLYDADPRQNLTSDQGFAEGLQDRLALGGRVLDIGCGPQRQKPAYLSRVADGDLVGIDPLPGAGERDFTFVKGIAEYLPFPDGSFDHVVFCRTLDHMLDFRAALRSAMRVTAAGGSVHILMDDSGDEPSAGAGRLARLRHILERGVIQLWHATRHQGLLRGLAYAFKAARLEVPPGAMDFFHSYFPTRDEVVEELSNAGAAAVETTMLGAELLITARKRDL